MSEESFRRFKHRDCMKVITIFSGKGGVGKTTFSILLASWLKYKLKERVVAYDFESPESRMMNKRNQDLLFLSNESPTLTRFVGENKDFYPMGAIKARTEGYTKEDLKVIATNIAKAKQSGSGYIICDFPGRFESKEAVYTLTRSGLIDIMVFPIQPEEQSIASMFSINNILNTPGFFSASSEKTKQEIYCFWNMVTKNDRNLKQDLLGRYETVMTNMQIPFSPVRINFVDTVKRLPTQQNMVVSTVCYPELNIIKAFPPRDDSKTPYIELLFHEIKDRVDAV